jgi:hypothetical protein
VTWLIVAATRTMIKVCGKDVRIQGGLIRLARLDGEKYVSPDDPETMIEGLRKSGTRVDIFTFLQRLPDTVPKYSYAMEWDNLAVLPISTFENWWNKQIRSYPRNRARQAEKRGVTLREVPFGDELLKGICEIYNECPMRQGKRFPYYGMTMNQAYDYARTFPDSSIFIGAFIGERMIGFGKLVTDSTRTHACLVHILSMVEHKDKAPTNALIAQAVRSCASRGIQYLVYEHFHYGKKQGDSLSHFKEVNGFSRVDIPRYFVPMTAIGTISLRLGLHHRVIDRLPASIVDKFRDLRTGWYNRKFHSVAEV